MGESAGLVYSTCCRCKIHKAGLWGSSLVHLPLIGRPIVATFAAAVLKLQSHLARRKGEGKRKDKKVEEGKGEERKRQCGMGTADRWLRNLALSRESSSYGELYHRY